MDISAFQTHLRENPGGPRGILLDTFLDPLVGHFENPLSQKIKPYAGFKDARYKTV